MEASHRTRVYGDQGRGICFVIGHATTTISTTVTASTCTQPTGNGFSTPRPNQPGTVHNYVTSHFISKGNTCGQVTWCNGILLQNLAKWNPHAREDRTDP
ncbi:hypothetical protein MY3296_008967 [Beauveria thailandica]